MEFITNQKGGQSLIWDGNRFTTERWIMALCIGDATNDHAQPESPPLEIPTLYNDALIELSTQPDCSMVHPNFYEFIEIIQKEQAATEVSIQQLSGGGRIRVKRKKVV